MLKVVIERQVKRGQDIFLLLRQLRMAALDRPGYITGETLASTEDPSVIVVISTWRNAEAWKAWEASEERRRLYEQIAPLLAGAPKVSTYQIASTEDRVASLV